MTSQQLYTRETYLIEEVNASGSFTAPLKVCSDLRQAVAWAIVRLHEHFPYVANIANVKIDITEWEEYRYTGVYVIPTMPLDQPELPMQIRVRVIEELTLS